MIAPTSAQSIPIYNASPIPVYTAPSIKPTFAPPVRRYDSTTPLGPCTVGGRFVRIVQGKLESNVAGQFHSGIGPAAATQENEITGERTNSVYSGASFGILTIHPNGHYTWGTIRGVMRLYVPGTCFLKYTAPFQTFFAINNGAAWYFLHHDPGDGSLHMFRSGADFESGRLTPVSGDQ